MDLDTMITTYNTEVTDAVNEKFGKERGRKKPWVTKDVHGLSDERKDLKRKLYDAEKQNNTEVQTGEFKRQ